MKTDIYQTDHQLQQKAFNILSKELGVTNFVRFIQYYEQGSGNYTLDRESWQSAYTVDSLTDTILKWKQDRKCD